MSIKVNKDLCIGCGVCESLCGDVFKLGDDGKSEAISQEEKDCVKKAVESCPVQAISIN